MKILLFVWMFLLMFALLAGWMPWNLALMLVLVDWVIGTLIYTRLNTQIKPPRCIPEDIERPKPLKSAPPMAA